MNSSRSAGTAPVGPARFGLAVVGVLAIGAAGNAAVNLILPPALYVPACLVTALGVLLASVRVGGCGPRDLGLARPDVASGLRHGAVAMGVVAVALALGAASPGTRELFVDRRVQEGSMVALAYTVLVRIPLGTVLLEELLFRGALLGLALRRWSPMRAVAFSCLAFGLWHLLPARGVASVNPVVAGVADSPLRRLVVVALAMGGTGLAGLVFCWLRLRSRSLLAPALLHLATNGFGYALAWTVLTTGTA